MVRLDRLGSHIGGVARLPPIPYPEFIITHFSWLVKEGIRKEGKGMGEYPHPHPPWVVLIWVGLLSPAR